MKRLRQWEEEKSVLEEGLKATKMAQDWYKTRLEGVSDRLRRGPEPSATPAANTEAMQVNFSLGFELQESINSSFQLYSSIFFCFFLA